MTKWAEMDARSRDALVAEKVMGGKWMRYHDAGYEDPDSHDNKVHAFIVTGDNFAAFQKYADYVEDTGECARDNYSWIARYTREIAAAWEVVEKMEADGFCPMLVNDDHGNWALTFDAVSELGPEVKWLNVMLDDVVWHPNPADAICHNSLRAKGVEI